MLTDWISSGFSIVKMRRNFRSNAAIAHMKAAGIYSAGELGAASETFLRSSFGGKVPTTFQFLDILEQVLQELKKPLKDPILRQGSC